MGGVRDAFMRARAEEHSILDPRRSRGQYLLRDLQSADALAEAHEFDRLARDGYTAHSVVRACIDEIADSAAEPEMQVEEFRDGRWSVVPAYGRGPTDAARELARLMADPAGDGMTSRYAWMRLFVTEYGIYGNALAQKVRGVQSGRTKRLQILRVPWVTPVRDQKGDPVTQIEVRQYLERQIGAASPAVTVPLSDLLHMKTVNPLDDFWGLAQMMSCLEDIDLDQQAHTYLRRFFKNNGTPAGLLRLKGVVAADQRRALQADLQRKFGGENAHAPMVGDNDAEWQEIGARPDRLKLDHIFDITESRICATYKVPPILVAVRIGLNSSTYSNYESARKSFWRETLRPLYQNIAGVLTVGVAREFGENLRISANFDRVEELRETLDAARAWAKDGYREGVLSHHEARDLVNLPSTGEDHFRTRTSDGKPFRIGEMPDPNPQSAKTPAPGSAKPTRDAAPADASATPEPGLRMLEAS